MINTALAPLELSRETLDELFKNSSSGPLPIGKGEGTVLIATNSPFGRDLARIGQAFWRGKLFDSKGTSLWNLLTARAIRAIRAEVYEGSSLTDNKPCIVLDYSKTSTVARWIRDEIRQVAPDAYLGIVFVKNRKIPVRFWLHFTENPSEKPAPS